MFPLQYSNNAAPKSSLKSWLGNTVNAHGTAVFPLSIEANMDFAKGSEGFSLSPNVVKGAAFPNLLTM